MPSSRRKAVMLVQRELTPIVDSDGEVHGEVVSITISAFGNGVRHPSAAVGEQQPITGGASPGNPDPSSRHSATDRHRCPREVTVISDDVERAQIEPMPPPATPLLTNMGLVASERFRPISVSIRRINLFGTCAMPSNAAQPTLAVGPPLLYPIKSRRRRPRLRPPNDYHKHHEQWT